MINIRPWGKERFFAMEKTQILTPVNRDKEQKKVKII
jgi:hypothetical protein